MEAVQVLRDDGQRGTVVQRLSTDEAAPQLVIAFADGSQLVVPEEVLVVQPIPATTCWVAPGWCVLVGWQ
jgi:hypothetical protein